MNLTTQQNCLNTYMIRALFFVLITLLPLSTSAGIGEKSSISAAFVFLDRNNIEGALAHAKASGSTVFAKYIWWLYLRDSSTNPSFSELSSFIEKNPDWPDRERLIRRSEAALLASAPSTDALKAWFAKYPAKTKKGKLSSGAVNGSDKADLIRTIWIEGDFGESEETRLLREYNDTLRSEDHIRRASRLVWDEEYKAAKRMMNILPAAARQMITARIALKTSAKNAPKEVEKVSSGLQRDAGLLYDRIRWKDKRDQDEGIKDILLIAPSDIPYPEKWWKYRSKIIREAIEDKNYKLARRLLKNHGQVDGPELIDALFLSGWLALEFEKNARDAYKEFYALYDETKYPHSRARAAYWAGRAAEKNGNKDISHGWFKKGADFPTTYYGQLCLFELGETGSLSLPTSSKPSTSDKASFMRGEIPQLVKLLASVGEDDRALKFIQTLADRADSKSEAALVAELGRDINRPDFSVKAAKKALQNGMLLVDYAYPVVKPNFDSPLEKAVILALTRQESEFNPRAVSPANAMGYMQLLPSTAKEVAKKAGIAYSRNRLFEPQYNMQLGSRYFDRLVNGFDGSYILASVGYNAGPGRARQWTNRFGSPGSNYRQAINWIEMIPFDETRNYVQRVLENTQVYRHLLAADGKKPKLQIAQDLVR